MRWTQKVSESIKKGIRSWLNITPSSAYNIQINETIDFETNAIRNRIWYRGDGNELEQMYSQVAEFADKHKFWASRCSRGMEMRKIHTGLPGLMVRTINSIIVSSMKDFKFENAEHESIWKQIEKENKFRKKFEKSLKETLVIGDGAYKITFDTDISQYPILEWYSGERIEIVMQRDRLKEVIFKTPYKEQSQTYVLHEHYGYGYIENHLYRGEQEVPLNAIKATETIVNWVFDKTLILAVPMQIYESAKFEGRGGSIFDGKLDSFDAFDEAWSQWMDALRAGRAKTYVPDCLVPRDPNTGKVIPPNPFDMRYLAADGDHREGQKNVISTDQPTIPHESYLASYITALDLCLQGVLSPSTLGIDTKKLDNAEAQREKEKTTLYTRNAIIEALQETIPELVAASVNAYRVLTKKQTEEVKVEVT
ncbi:MAG: capsid protein, partial [Fusicatenibacter sp.]|nr:capsid protein [Fusicatenibacter sp.]